MAIKRRNVSFTESQLRQLAAAKRKTGVPVAEIVRRAVDAYLKQMSGKAS